VYAAILVALFATPGFAQNYEFDARRIAMGSVGAGDNPAQSMVRKDSPYGSIVVPIGLFQVLRNRNLFDPNSNEFNPVIALEYLASPLHFIVNRDAGDTSGAFVNALRNGAASRDLNTYRGFALPHTLSTAGLLAPHWGGTIHLANGRDGSYQGLYVGAGPYLSVDTNLTSDQRLVDLFASTTNVFLPHTTFTITNPASDQLAMAVTGGYRARIALQGTRGARDGVYLAANYNYLRGFRYDKYNLDVTLDTDGSGLLTGLPSSTAVLADRETASSGHGYSIDLGAEIVANGWDVGAGASGVGNRIDWTNFQHDQYAMTSLGLVTSGAFVHTQLMPATLTEQVKLPVRKTGNLGYSASQWSFETEISSGLLGRTFNSGAEIRLHGIDLRAGGRYVKNRWHGSAGIGLNAGPRFAIDVAAYGTSANLEQHEKLALAVSLRFNHTRKK
jgi:hypothetical protein